MKLKKVVKRIVALGTGATMLGATVLGAMAADLSEYPTPMFIKDGKFNGLIVIGADADTQDMLGAMDIISSLQAVAVSGSSGTSATVSTVGDVYQFEKASDMLNLGEAMTAIREKLSDTQLPIVLADGTLTTAKGAKYNYEQEVLIGAKEQLQFFEDKDYLDEKNVIGIKITRNNPVLNYTLDFTKDAKSTVTSDDATEFEDRTIELLGETFDIISSSPANLELDLMRGALKPTLEEGETATYTITGKQYEVTALIIDDANDKVKFKVNGEVTDSMVAGDIYETSDGTLIGVREILPNEAGDVTQDMVEFYLGAKKIVLASGNELEIDDEDVSNVDVYITNGTSVSGSWTIDKMTLAWEADDDLFLTEDGNEVAMPGLESIKFYMEGFYKGKEEKISVSPSSDDTITIDAPLKDYDVKLDVLYDTSAGTGWDYLGGSATKQLLTRTCGKEFVVNMDTDEYFVVTKINGKEAETAVLQLSKVHDTNGITVKDYAGNVVAEDKRATKTFDAADMTVTVVNFTQANSNASFTIADTNCVNATMVTKEGLKIYLPSNENTTSTRGIQTQVFANSLTILIPFSEEDKDENIGAGRGYKVNATFNADSEATILYSWKNNLSNTNTYSVDDTKVYEGYMNTTVSSKITEDKTADQYDVDIVYPGEETYADLYIGSKASKVTTTAGGEAVAVTKIEVGAAVMDTSLTSYTTQNLIVVGGPAINRAAAALLGKTYPAYGADSGIPENAGILKLVANTDKVALIVAGWEADDTQRASRVLAEYDTYALSGAEVQVTGTSMTDITVGVPAAATA